MHLRNGLYVIWQGREYLDVTGRGGRFYYVLSSDPEDLERGFQQRATFSPGDVFPYEGWIPRCQVESAHLKYWWGRHQGRDYEIANVHRGIATLCLRYADRHLAHELGFTWEDRDRIEKRVPVAELEATWAICKDPPPGYPFKGKAWKFLRSLFEDLMSPRTRR